MRLLVAGSSSSVPRPGRASSCYAVVADDCSVVLDLGSGGFSRLRAVTDYSALGAVVITHMHADHFLDLIPLRYGLVYGPLQRDDRLPLYLPPGGETILRRLCAAFAPEGEPNFLDSAFSVSEYDPDAGIDVGALKLSFAKTKHYVHAYAVRLDSGEASMVYSGDTAPCDSVVRLAAEADVFLCEATLGFETESEPRGHSSAAEAGEMARRAGARRLALTHYGSTFDPEALVAAARETFDGPIVAVDDGMEIDV
jgi:ribonuclease BN (tRNA processing enzyme)